MSIRKYIAYLRTVETGSITQTANELGYTQSAVSKMIADLESEWNVRLLNRSRSGIELTSDGIALLPAVRAVVKEY
ncbi:MAG: LysR family transcriptional regulator, partial [Oscillospiraceae bacterium]|nr:LysR family transcriptional regulator [Oscillospiraceae bacterium]